MPDEIIEELWRIKDSIAREQGNDARQLVAYLQSARPGASPRRSVVDILNDGPGKRASRRGRAGRRGSRRGRGRSRCRRGRRIVGASGDEHRSPQPPAARQA